MPFPLNQTTQRKIWFGWAHPHTDSVNLQLRGAESGKCRKQYTNQCLDFSLVPASCTVWRRQTIMVVHLFASSYVSAGPCPVDVPAFWQLMWDSIWLLYEQNSSLKPHWSLCKSIFYWAQNCPFQKINCKYYMSSWPLRTFKHHIRLPWCCTCHCACFKWEIPDLESFHWIKKIIKKCPGESFDTLLSYIYHKEETHSMSQQNSWFVAIQVLWSLF